VFKRKEYGVMNIEWNNFSFSDEERSRYESIICYTHSGLAFYKIRATWIEYITLRIKFFVMRCRTGSKVFIKKLY